MVDEAILDASSRTTMLNVVSEPAKRPQMAEKTRHNGDAAVFMGNVLSLPSCRRLTMITGCFAMPLCAAECQTIIVSIAFREMTAANDQKMTVVTSSDVTLVSKTSQTDECFI